MYKFVPDSTFISKVGKLGEVFLRVIVAVGWGVGSGFEGRSYRKPLGSPAGISERGVIRER